MPWTKPTDLRTVSKVPISGDVGHLGGRQHCVLALWEDDTDSLSRGWGVTDDGESWSSPTKEGRMESQQMAPVEKTASCTPEAHLPIGIESSGAEGGTA